MADDAPWDFEQFSNRKAARAGLPGLAMKRAKVRNKCLKQQGLATLVCFKTGAGKLQAEKNRVMGRTLKAAYVVRRLSMPTVSCGASIQYILRLIMAVHVPYQRGQTVK